MTSSANETDQYHLPTHSIRDLGPALQLKLENILNQVAAKAGTEEDVQRLFFRHVGNPIIAGFPVSQMELWFTFADFGGEEPKWFDPPFTQTIYRRAGWYRPVIDWTLSPTLRMFDVEFGLDKIGHFFQQGYLYWKIFQKTHQVQDVIAMGVKAESGVWGRFFTGVIANGDLAANYSGFRFFQLLTEPQQIDGIQYPPLLVRVENDHQLGWQRNPDAHLRELLPLFFGPFLNEALNPSIFLDGMRGPVQKSIEKACVRWHELKQDLTREKIIGLETLARTFHGEDYGRLSDSRGELSLSHLCFESSEE